MSISRLLIIFGLSLVALGLLWPVINKIGLGRLPGDIVIERDNFRVYIPLATSLLVSVILSLILGSLTVSRRRLLLRVHGSRECSRPACRQHHRLRREQPWHPHKSGGPHPKRERASCLEQGSERFEGRCCPQVD